MNFTEWKQKAMEKIVLDEDIGKLLKYNTADALFREPLTEEEAYALIDKNVFGYRYIPDPVSEQQSFISLGLGNFIPDEGFRRFSNAYIMGYLWVYILVDNSIFKTDSGYRQDLLLARIHHLFQSSDDFGIGEVRLESTAENWQHKNKFGGYTVGFKVVEMR